MNGIYVNAYEDELCYSVFGRFFVRSGYLSYRSVAEDLFVNSKARANMELCNLLTDDAQKQIGSMESFILEHSMFNYYRAFLPPDKQAAVWDRAMAMDIKQLSNSLPLAKVNTRGIFVTARNVSKRIGCSTEKHIGTERINYMVYRLAVNMVAS